MLNNGITFSEGQTRQVNNSLFELQSKGQTNECRKVQIGDLSSIDKSLKEKAERKLNHAKNVKQKQFSSAAKSLQNRVDYLIYHAEQPSTKDQALISGSQYNCDPMNDPIYEKKAFNGTLKQSANAMPIAPKLDFSSSAQSQKTYFAEPSLPSSPVAPQIQRKGSKDAETIFKRLSSYPSFIQQQTTPAQKKTVPDAQNARKSILVNLKQLNMNFGQRPRSVSDPLVRWSKFLGANKPSPLVSRRAKDSAKSEVGLKGHKEKSHDQRNRSTSFQRSSFPIKITSFTPGERISQEYIFGKKSETISDRIAYSAGRSGCDAPKIEYEIARDDKTKQEVLEHLSAVAPQISENLADDKACKSENFHRENEENYALNNSEDSASSCTLQLSMRSWRKRSSRAILTGKSYKGEADSRVSDSAFRDLEAGSVRISQEERDAYEYMCSPPACSSDSENSADETSSDFTLVWNSKDFGQSKNKFSKKEEKLTRSKSKTNLRLLRTVSEGTWRFQRNDSGQYKIENRRRSETVINSNHEPNGKSSSTSRQNDEIEPQRPTARRAAVVSTLPNSDLSDLSDTIANLQRNQPVGLTSAELKRSRWAFPKLSFMSKDKSREQKLEDFLTSWKPTSFDPALEASLQKLKNCQQHAEPRITRFTSHSSPTNHANSKQRKRNNAVWELFASERTYLVDHLLVLQQVFMEPLQELQCEGFLLSVDVRSVFGNLEELCKVTMDFCHALLGVVGEQKSGDFGSAASIDSAFDTFESIVCPPYQRYVSGYDNSLNDRENLKSDDDYIMFLKWCEQSSRCQRLKLNDFLVAPMQHLTKYPLLLRNIAKYTDDKQQNESIERTQLAVQEALKALEGKVTWTNHYQFLQDLQSSITWPPVFEIDTKTILPEALRAALSEQPCKNLIANPKRELVLEGFLTAVENGKPFEVYAFLFDDMLLLTKPKKGKRKQSEIPSSLKRHELMKDGTLLSVHRQPIALDRFMVYDIDGDQAAGMGLKRAFVLVQENRFQQMYSIALLQASSDSNKKLWLAKLASTAAQWMEKNVYSHHNKSLPIKSSFCNGESSEDFSSSASSNFHDDDVDEEEINRTEKVLENRLNFVENIGSEIEQDKPSSSNEENTADSDCEKSDFL